MCHPFQLCRGNNRKFKAKYSYYGKYNIQIFDIMKSIVRHLSYALIDQIKEK